MGAPRNTDTDTDTTAGTGVHTGVDVLFIDALHTYCHVLYELDTFSPVARKYIMLHDTGEPWARADEPFSGEIDHSVYPYPAVYDRTKRGVLTAVEDFLAREENKGIWTIKLQKPDNSGFMVLERLQSNHGEIIM